MRRAVLILLVMGIAVLPGNGQDVSRPVQLVGTNQTTNQITQVIVKIREIIQQIITINNQLDTLNVKFNNVNKAVTNITNTVGGMSSIPGPAGKDGRDGFNGKAGLNAQNGIDGQNGANGVVDYDTIFAWILEHKSEFITNAVELRPIVVNFLDGDGKIANSITVPPGGTLNIPPVRATWLTQDGITLKQSRVLGEPLKFADELFQAKPQGDK